MTELFLEYKDERGEVKREPVLGNQCVVGRHTESDICIPDGRLSRQHLKLDRFGDVFVASDAGSSNGTTLNSEPLKEPIALKKGDVLELGGLKIDVVFESDEPAPEQPSASGADLDGSSASAGNGISVASQAAGSGGSNSLLLWIAIPVFGLIFLFFGGAIIFFLVSGPSTTVAKQQNDSTDTDGGDDYPDSTNKKSSNKDDNKNSGSSNSGSSNTSSNGSNSSGTTTLPTGNLTETAKIEQSGSAFLRLIARKDPRAFLTTEQATKINPKIKQYSGSSAVADNLKSANQSATQIKALAQQKGVRPQFLAVAAVAKLGNSRGDVYKTAESMADVLSKLSETLGAELGEDAVLVIAVYGQGAAGEFLKMRNMLQDLANKSPESARTIRTIWYLQQNGKITQAEFDMALNFLAIGTISQNPKDFGVNAEALVL